MTQGPKPNQNQTRTNHTTTPTTTPRNPQPKLNQIVKPPKLTFTKKKETTTLQPNQQTQQPQQPTPKNKPLVPLNQKPDVNSTTLNNQPDLITLIPTPTTTTLKTTGKKKITKPDCDKPTPESDVTVRNLVPETETRKPPKLKTEVVPSSEFKLYLARKKQERELKLLNLRGNVTVEIPDKPPSTIGDSAALHPTSINPLSTSALGIIRTDVTALSTDHTIGGNQNLSAELRGTPDMSGKLLLARK